MSQYLVRGTFPDGSRRYLALGRFVRRENATRYPHPSNAHAARRSYLERNREKMIREGPIVAVVNERTGREA